ncbi:BON domain-containing protein [Nitrosovibrio sp. Nv17]|uniref:BON domain-containing protein n=1 Tax=Nitrosovibrio sp. Nv17 TaxID=1855339 RepID=UPI000908ABE4|nr:BON domain-containing protein [Nitrosovibrio sp. Nv17]SFW23462.1 hyperosmotically inducible protein [Nitrosovibrio sp. Nv17]
MNDGCRCRKLILAMALMSAIAATGCTKPEEKVHESWITPPEGAAIDDTSLASSIHAALRADPSVSNLNVKIEASNGEILLSGYVNSQEQMDRVVMLAWMAEGARKVENKLTLGSGGTVEDD